MKFSHLYFLLLFFLGLHYATPLNSIDDDNDEILFLNVGGTKIDISRETINNSGEGSILYTLFNGPMKKYKRDKEGRIFLQRDPQTFQMLLNYLMGYDVLGGKASQEERWVRMLYQEADYWFVERLLKEIEQLPDYTVTTNKYHGGMKGLKEHGFGFRHYTDFSTYAGQFENGVYNGEGILSDLGGFYDGQFKDGYYDGKGVMTINEGVYKGEFKKGFKTGKAKVEYKNGDIYEGDFKNNKRDGKGKLITKKGVYEGTFVDNHMKEGTFLSKNGDHYTGSFDFDLMEEGVLQYADGRTFQGILIYGLLDNGVLTYPDGRIYTGNFKNELFNGFGVLEHTIEGWKYEGEFKDGMFNGFGTMTYPDGSSYSGQWIDNEKHQ